MSKKCPPPMGWNSWDCFGTTVTEDETKANALFISENLADQGWNTVVVDIDWYDPTARDHGYNANAPLVLDSFGRQLPDPSRFPSSADGSGFTSLASYIHHLGLKFGVHLMRGIPRLAVKRNCPVFGTEWTAQDIVDYDHTCTWNPDNYGLNHDHPGAQAWYDAQVDQLVQWGVDFFKVDDMQSPFYNREIQSFNQSIEKARKKYRKEIVFSLSPGAMGTTHSSFLQQNAQMWRVSDDLWDRWSDIYPQFARLSEWSHYSEEGHWPDADMLPLGHLGIRAEQGEDRQSLLSHDEQKTVLTLWAMAKSPLFIGGDLPTSNADTIKLFTNPELRRVTEETSQNREITHDTPRLPWGATGEDNGEFIVWTAALPATNSSSESTSRIYAAFFWTGPKSKEIDYELSYIFGIDKVNLPWKLSNLWDDNSPVFLTGSGMDKRIKTVIPSHGTIWVAFDL